MQQITREIRHYTKLPKIVNARNLTFESQLNFWFYFINNSANRDVIKLLVELGANINARNEIGLTPLAVARAYGNCIVSYLLVLQTTRTAFLYVWEFLICVKKRIICYWSFILKIGSSW